MFERIIEHNSSWDESEPNRTRYHRKVVDTDFSELVDVGYCGGFGSSINSAAVIKVYEKRGLNVAANLALMHKWYNEGAHRMDIGWQFEKSILFVPKYEKYAEEVKKYLMMI